MRLCALVQQILPSCMRQVSQTDLGQDDAIDAWRRPCRGLSNEAIIQLGPAAEANVSLMALTSSPPANPTGSRRCEAAADLERQVWTETV
jgi:hypothetical protein